MAEDINKFRDGGLVDASVFNGYPDSNDFTDFMAPMDKVKKMFDNAKLINAGLNKCPHCGNVLVKEKDNAC